MAATFPNGIVNLATLKYDNTHRETGGGSGTQGDHALHHSRMAEEINAMEAELGANPKGPYATSVRNRFEILDWKRSCRVATPSNTNIAGTYAAGPPATKAVGGTSLTIDGVTLVNGDRVFLKDQSTATENGIYEVSGVGTAVVLTRTYDGDTSTKVSDSCFISVEQGAQNQDSTWELNSNNPITLGTTPLYYTRVHPAYPVATVPPHANNVYLPTLPSPALMENFQRLLNKPMAVMAAATLSTGVIRSSLMGVARAGQPITGISFASNTTSAGTTNVWAGIARASDRVVLAVSANSTAQWAAARRDFPFAAGVFTPLRDELILAFLMTASSTTMPQLFGDASMSSSTFFNSAAVFGNHDTTQAATPKAVGSTLAAATGVAGAPYCWLY